mgnify:CR=1 FL=1
MGEQEPPLREQLLRRELLREAEIIKERLSKKMADAYKRTVGRASAPTGFADGSSGGGSVSFAVNS